jgi:hypothetical protein
MTDINQHHHHTLLQNDIIPEEETQQLEEGDITEAANNLHVNRKPSIHINEQEHTHGDSESEEDLTDEHVNSESFQLGNNNITTPEEYNASSVLSNHEHEEEEVNEEEEEEEQQEEESSSNAGTLQQQQQQHPTELTSPPPITLSPPNITNSRGRSVSSASPSTTTINIGLLPRSQRVWEMDRQAPECRRCHRRFNFLVRRHHCRYCIYNI